MSFTIDPYRFPVPSEGKRLFMWGYNGNYEIGAGKIGNGNRFDVDTPEQVGIAEWDALSIGLAATMARKSDGTLWMWGRGDSGQLGQGDYSSAGEPVQVGTDTDWSAHFASGKQHTLAIKTDGTLWAWGSGSNGALGTGGTTEELTPVQVGLNSDWTAIAAGQNFSLGLRSGGTLWSWGTDSDGALGQGATTQLLSPTQVGVASDWTTSFYAGIRSAAAVNNSGRAYLWGLAQYNATVYWSENVPTLLDANTDHAFVVAGYDNFHIVKTNGTLWAFGKNDSGQLGDGTTTGKEVPPLQIGSNTNWTSTIAGTDDETLALLSDGTVWGWGGNTSGTIGDGSTTQRESPVQVGSATDWTFVTSGGNTSGGLRPA